VTACACALTWNVQLYSRRLREEGASSGAPEGDSDRSDQLLGHAGFEVLDAVDAGASLRILANRPDVRVLFTEVRLRGDVDGLQLARMVHEQWPNVRLLITSTGQRTAAGEVADHGHFLPKPYLRHERSARSTPWCQADVRAIRQNVSNQKGRSDVCRE
jgi:hypothetical protein